MTVKKVAMLTAGGLAPCLSSAVAALIERWTELDPSVELIAYRGGYTGLLKGHSVSLGADARAHADALYQLGGSPIGNSRVKLTNVEDCRRRGLVGSDEDPLEVAARQLTTDGVDVLHTIGGDDTNTTAADLAAYLADHDYDLTVVGLPKTIDNDIVPVAQSLGAWTAADQGVVFARNVIAEHSANPRSLIINEVMGRACGYLTAETARRYHAWVSTLPTIEGLVDPRAWDVHAVYLPELAIDIDAEAARLRQIMDSVGNVNIFLSEGAGVNDIVEALKAAGEQVPVDPFGHVKLDKINPGQYFATQFSDKLSAEKTQVFKGGYFTRSAASNAEDKAFIIECAQLAVDSARAGVPGLVGQDEGQGGKLRAIEFPRVAGHKPFDVSQPWFAQLLAEIGQR